jgi:iron complex transport system substrate-binding protein
LNKFQSLFLLFIFFFFSCQNETGNQNSKAPNGNEKDLKLIGLSPALTEMLFFACPDSIILARSQACNYPEEALKKPIIQTYPLDIEALIALQPDLILNEEGIIALDQIELIKKQDLNIKTFQYRKMSDVFNAILEVGNLCLCSDSVVKKVNKQKATLKALKKNSIGKKAIGLIWTDPIYVYGQHTLFTDQIAYLGLENPIDESFDKQYPEVSREYLLRINPDIIFGLDFAHLDSTLFSDFPELKRLKAYKDSAIYFVDSDILTRPGPRSILAITEMQKAVYEK